MNVLATQQRLVAQGYSLTADGILGPMTYAALLSYAAGRTLGQTGIALGAAMNDKLVAHGIVSGLGLIHWITQGCHETGGFRLFVEEGSTAYFAKYDAGTPIGKSLGNTNPGDGYLFRGRGIFEITGRYNYAQMAQKTGLDLLSHPELAATPDVSVLVACLFWQERGIEALADADDLQGVRRKINGGENGLADCQAILDRLKSVTGLA